MKYLVIIAAIQVSLINSARAETGLTIHAGEIGISKFHRKDNNVHPYTEDNAWKPFVLSNTASTKTPQTFSNKDGSYTIIFSNLEELFKAAKKLSLKKNLKIENFNLNTHGLPGHMWYPKDAATQAGDECKSWRRAASAEDEVNYNQYYSLTQKDVILQIRDFAQHSTPNIPLPCISGLNEWRELAVKHRLKKFFAPNAQIHFLSCTVGLGVMGDIFTKGIANLLLSHESGRVQTTLQYGLGDWSLPEGMGFWDYISDEQFDRDNTHYPMNRSDREIMQKGTIRTAGFLNGTIVSSLMEQRDFMYLDGREPGVLTAPSPTALQKAKVLPPMPESIVIPGTQVRIFLKK